MNIDILRIIFEYSDPFDSNKYFYTIFPKYHYNKHSGHSIPENTVVLFLEDYWDNCNIPTSVNYIFLEEIIYLKTSNLKILQCPNGCNISDINKGCQITIFDDISFGGVSNIPSARQYTTHMWSICKPWRTRTDDKSRALNIMNSGPGVRFYTTSAQGIISDPGDPWNPISYLDGKAMI